MGAGDGWDIVYAKIPDRFRWIQGEARKGGLIKTVSKLYYYLPSYSRTVMEHAHKPQKEEVYVPSLAS
jgi:hypothetical protein